MIKLNRRKLLPLIRRMGYSSVPLARKGLLPFQSWSAEPSASCDERWWRFGWLFLGTLAGVWRWFCRCTPLVAPSHTSLFQVDAKHTVHLATPWPKHSSHSTQAAWLFPSCWVDSEPGTVSQMIRWLWLRCPNCCRRDEVTGLMYPERVVNTCLGSSWVEHPLTGAYADELAFICVRYDFLLAVHSITDAFHYYVLPLCSSCWVYLVKSLLHNRVYVIGCTFTLERMYSSRRWTLKRFHATRLSCLLL